MHLARWLSGWFVGIEQCNIFEIRHIECCEGGVRYFICCEKYISGVIQSGIVIECTRRGLRSKQNRVSSIRNIHHAESALVNLARPEGIPPDETVVYILYRINTDDNRIPGIGQIGNERAVLQSQSAEQV